MSSDEATCGSDDDKPDDGGPIGEKQGPRLRQAQFCPHCSQTLAHATYHEHRRKYFNADTGVWTLQGRDSAHDDSAAPEQQLGAVLQEATHNKQVSQQGCNTTLHGVAGSASFEQALTDVCVVSYRLACCADRPGPAAGCQR